MRRRRAVVLLFEQSKLLWSQNSANLLAQSPHRGAIERTPGGVYPRECIDQRFNSLLLIGHEVEWREATHVPTVERLRR
jgi:hypothetical protein